MPSAKPAAVLEPRPGDEILTIKQLEQISLFADLSRQPELDQQGTVVLRHFNKDEVICRQNDPGWTAFYVLTGKDLKELRENRGLPARQEAEENVAQQPEPKGEGDPLVVATVRVATTPSEVPGILDGIRRVFGELFGRAVSQAGAECATLAEGDLFGEMSCLYRLPRSATVVAERECYVLEIFRNILDKMYSNANRAFKDKVDLNYRQRVLESQLRNLTFFRALPPELHAELHNRAKLVDFEPGALIWDEHDRSDCLYVIRTGFVKVVKNTSFLLCPEAVPNKEWNRFCVGLQADTDSTSQERRRIWQLLGPATQNLIRGSATGLTPDQKAEVVHALNDLLKQPKLFADPEMKDVIAKLGLQDEKPPTSLKKWSQYQRVCGLNRRLLETIYPDVFPQRDSSAHAERILAYNSVGDSIGEMGLVRNMPRSATCIAYDHPESSKFGRVELVRIDAELLNDLRKASSQWETEILGLTEKRAEHAKKQIGLPFWHEGTEERLTERFDELGLVQGQKMMLIDLYRCTRCDKCVDACVKTHKDKRSRLFLDGPRYQRQEDSGLRTYLVPATCRQCKDPVCLIGCPVGSIHKGDNGQIVIENWCIGCQRCAQQCPYGAIQMHAVGIIPRRARGWCYRFRSDDSWHEGQTPFTYNRKLREQSSGKSEVHFRYAFRLAQDVAQKTKSFQLRILSLAPVLTVTTNGKQVLQTSPGQSPPKPKKDKSEEYNHEVMLFLESGPAEGQQDKSVGLPVMRLEENVIEICLGLPVNEDAVLLDLGLYAFSKPSVPTELAEELNQEVVMNTAVVCDMCSSQFGKQPACVNACPHDAAIRVDAQVFLGPELRG